MMQGSTNIKFSLRPQLHWSQNRHDTTVWTDSR